MSCNPKKIVIITVLFAGFVLSFPYYSRAEFTLTAVPREGSQELDFSPISPGISEINREVDIKIRSDIATQYELRQEPLSALTNGRGDEISWNNLSVRGLRGTNQFGTLRTEPYKVINTVLYTSNSNGAQDTFTLVYSLTVPQETKTDFYRGQIRYSLIPIGANQSPASLFLNVIANVKTELGRGEEKPLIEITTPNISKVISLNSKKQESGIFEVSAKINRNPGNMFSLKQFLTGPLESGEGNLLPWEAVNVELKDVGKGTGIAKSPLSPGPQIIYTSEASGEASSDFGIVYTLGDLSAQPAGRYRSRIQYSIEQVGSEEKVGSLEIAVEIERIFDLSVKLQDEGDILEFRDLKPEESSKTSEVIIEVKNNTGKQYQVGQNVFADLSASTGEKIPGENFTLRTEGLDTKGVLKFLRKTQVKIGETALFISDTRGSADKFKIVYELLYPKEVKGGNYSTRVSYSLSEI